MAVKKQMDIKTRKMLVSVIIMVIITIMIAPLTIAAVTIPLARQINSPSFTSSAINLNTIMYIYTLILFEAFIITTFLVFRTKAAVIHMLLSSIFTILIIEVIALIIVANNQLYEPYLIILQMNIITLYSGNPSIVMILYGALTISINILINIKRKQVI